MDMHMYDLTWAANYRSRYNQIMKEAHHYLAVRDCVVLFPGAGGGAGFRRLSSE